MKPRVAIAAVLVASALLSFASSQEEFLPPEQAFRYLAEIDGGCLEVHWNVAPGYYLYKGKLGLESATPGITLGKPHYPQGEIHKDEYFGEQEIFRDDFTVTAPIARTDGKARELTLKLKWQGCADAGLCYPPTVWNAKVALPEPPP